MTVYILYFIFLAILAIQYEFIPFKNNVLLGFVVIVLALLAGLRGTDVSKDYYSYSYISDNISDITSTNDLSYFVAFEPGFIAIIILIRRIVTSNYVLALMLFYAVTSISLKIYSIKRLSINPYLTVLFYFSYYFLMQDMAQIRIGLASAIFLTALIPFFKGKRMLYAGLIIFATFFHYSAIFYLLLLIFNTTKFNRNQYTAVLLLSIVLAFVKLPLLNILGNFDFSDISNKFSNYVELSKNGSLSINFFNSLNICNILCCIYLIYFTDKQKLLEDNKLILFLKCNILSIFLLGLLTGVPAVALRFSQLFGIVQIFLFTYLVKSLPAKKYNVLILVALAGFFFYIIGIYGNLLSPYKIVDFK